MSSSQKSPEPFHRIVVATDGSENALRAIKVAIEVASRYGAELIVVNAIAFPLGVSAPASPDIGDPQAMMRFSELARAEARKITEEGVRLARTAGVQARSAVLDRAASAVELIASFAEAEHADLIVSGTRGLTGFKKLFVGSVSSGLLNRASCSVLVVR